MNPLTILNKNYPYFLAKYAIKKTGCFTLNNLLKNISLFSFIIIIKTPGLIKKNSLNYSATTTCTSNFSIERIIFEGVLLSVIIKSISSIVANCAVETLPILV